MQSTRRVVLLLALVPMTWLLPPFLGLVSQAWTRIQSEWAEWGQIADQSETLDKQTAVFSWRAQASEQVFRDLMQGRCGLHQALAHLVWIRHQPNPEVAPATPSRVSDRAAVCRLLSHALNRQVGTSKDPTSVATARRLLDELQHVLDTPNEEPLPDPSPLSPWIPCPELH